MKRKKLRPACGVTIGDSKYLFIHPPMPWWESTEKENYCARCDRLIEFEFPYRSRPGVTPQSPEYWIPGTAGCGCADGRGVRLRTVRARRHTGKSDPRQVPFNF